MARVTAALMANLAADATPPPANDEPSTVSGIGIGNTTYRGRACVVRDVMLACSAFTLARLAEVQQEAPVRAFNDAVTQPGRTLTA